MWRVPPNLALASNLLPSLEQQVTQLQQQLIAATSRPLDLIYARIGIINGYFFPQGWGDLGAVNLEQDIKLMQAWPPPGLKIDWKRIDHGTRDGLGFKLYEGRFRTPCVSRIFDALPPESRTARVQLLVPHPEANSSRGGTAYQPPAATRSGDVADDFRLLSAGGSHSSSSTPAAALHLAATGDQGFGRRLRLAFPLLKHGVSSLVLESPYYGARRPAAQRGSKLLRVSDLFALGWATIYESMNLLHWLTQEGFNEGGLCMAGLSMGGVHACMTAALYPQDVACAALLAPRSAAVAYCDGALSAAMAWQPLLKELDDRNNHVAEVIRSTAQRVSVLREATHALAELELAWEAAGITRSAGAAAAGMAVRMTPQQHASFAQAAMQSFGSHAAAAAAGAAAAGQPASALSVAVGPGSSVPLARQAQQLSDAAQWLRDGGLQGASVGPGPTRGAADGGAAVAAGMQRCGHSVHAGTPEAGLPMHATSPASSHHVHAGGRGSSEVRQGSHTAIDGLQPGQQNQRPTPLQVTTAQQQQLQQQTAGEPRADPSQVALTCSLDGPHPSQYQQAGQPAGSANLPGDADWKPMLLSMLRGLSELKSLSVSDAAMERQKTLRRLKNVLETYTDITRFPVPRRPDAAVFVAASHDAYVTQQSVQQLADYWAGSEMRVVSGGHVTAFLMHQDKFRGAILDAIQRLKQAPPAAQPHP